MIKFGFAIILILGYHICISMNSKAQNAYLDGFIKAANSTGMSVQHTPKAPVRVNPAPQQPIVADKFNPANFVNPLHKEVPIDPNLHKAINLQESGGQQDGIVPGSNDNGEARGPLQIHLPAWQDATNYNPALGKYSYMDVTNGPLAKATLQSYENRYEPKDIRSGNLYNQAVVWNGGPGALRNGKADGYGKSVINYIRKIL
jgi:hypothetical protein